MLQNQKFSIVDIETTGGRRKEHRITEIAIINVDHGVVTERFESLVNPERSIPSYIEKLTGIHNDMVLAAPKFYQLAKKIVTLTEGRILVGHNVFFDYHFLRHEFSELGFTFKRPTLCTVRLARQLLPGHESYSLGKLCSDLGIAIENRHRAMGDAQGCFEVLKVLSQKQPSVETSALPSGLAPKDIEALPSTPGVYFFKGQNDQLLYVGKSVNIQKRVKSHFSSNLKKRKYLELKGQVEKIDYQEMGSELSALLWECHIIKTKRPRYNVSLRRKRLLYALELRENAAGEQEIALVRRNPNENYHFAFSRKGSAKSTLNKLYQKILGVEKDAIDFEKVKNQLIDLMGLKEYNQKVSELYHQRILPCQNFQVSLPGRKKGEQCTIEVLSSYPVKMIFQSEKQREEYPLFIHQDLKRILHGHIIKYQIPIEELHE
jgi:DNA polymerase-3 subunit epsilon